MKLDLHDMIVRELYDKKSLAALIHVIDFGRELEFKVNGKEYFISRDRSEKYVSLWDNKTEQSFDSVYELIENAVVDDDTLLSVWDKVELAFLF